MASNKDIFAELNEQIKNGNTPDTFTIGGETFSRVRARPGDAPVKKLWKNPRTGVETEELVESVTINVAPHADRVILDGVNYLAGRTYDMPKAKADSVRDIIAQTWKHEAQTGGAYSYGNAAARNFQAAASRPGVGFAN